MTHISVTSEPTDHSDLSELPDDPPLPNGDLNEIAEVAVALAKRGGDILMDRFHATIEITFKGQNAHDPVTEVDHAIEDMIRDEVHRAFPEHGVLGEERDNGGPLDAEIVWVIDPLDGTSNFINGIGMFACSIGVLHNGAPIAGALWLPSNRFLTPGVYHSKSGDGLMFNGEDVDSGAPPLQAASRLSTVPAGTGGVTGPAGRRFGIARTFGSTATELALAAEGSVQMALFDGSRIWDVAGGVALCIAAGRAVYTKSRRSEEGWRPFTRFCDRIDGPVHMEQLRKWSDPLVAGDATVLPDSAAALKREQSVAATAKRAAVKSVKRAFPNLPLPSYP